MYEKEMRKQKILIADDSELNREILKHMVEEQYDILEAGNGKEAIDMLRKYGVEISVFLLDIRMPIADGFQVLEFMNHYHWIEDIPVIAISADGSHENIRRAYELGVTDYVDRGLDGLIIRRRVANAIGLFTKQKKMREQNAVLEEENNWLQNRDPLTGCLNFSGFKKMAYNLIKNNPQKKYAIMTADINNFRYVNDSLGFQAGDGLLKHWAKIIEKDILEGEALGRISGDTFAILKKYNQPEDLEERFYRKVQRVEYYLDEPNRKISVDIVEGIYLVRPEERQNPDINKMLDRASAARKQVKGGTEKRVNFFGDELWNRQMRESEISFHLQEALEFGEVQPWFQPQFDYITGKIIGAEALARWIHPNLGEISPGEFIPILERSGQIGIFDLYVWRESCRCMRKWMDESGKYMPISLAVNVSRLDIHGDWIYGELQRMIEEFKLEPYMLHLEITEGAYMDEPDQLIAVVNRLHELGFVVEMDDFGSGFSSLNMLKDVPVDMLKLDMRFLRESENNVKGGKILSSVVRMANLLGIPTIAEGVETLGQAEFLKSIGCHFMQGYYFSRPLPLEEFERLLEKSDTEEIRFRNLENEQQLQEFMNYDYKNSFMFNLYIGGALLFETNGESVNAIMINDSFCQALDIQRDEVEAYRNDILPLIRSKDRDMVRETISKAIAEKNAVCTVETENSGRKVQIKMRYLTSLEGNYILFAMLDEYYSST